MNGKPSHLRLWLLLLLPALLACAEVDDLGDEPPDSTLLRGTSITWVDGIGHIFATKCGTCHTDTPDASVPVNTPGDLDLNRYQGDGATMRGALDILPFLRAGLLDGNLTEPPVRRMPLPYATPLTEHETRNLVLWTEAGGPSGAASGGCVPPADDVERTLWETRGQELFSNATPIGGGTACRACHPFGHYSGLACSLLEPRVAYMVDAVAGNGTGTWNALPTADQDALLFYVAR